MVSPEAAQAFSGWKPGGHGEKPPVPARIGKLMCKEGVFVCVVSVYSMVYWSHYSSNEVFVNVTLGTQEAFSGLLSH